MKKATMKVFLVLCTILAVSIIACEQLDNDMKHVVNQEKNIINDKINDELLAGKTDIYVRCDGICSNRIGSCMAFINHKTKSIKCGCENCTMVVEHRLTHARVTNDEYREIALTIFQDKVYLSLLEDFIQEKHPNQFAFIEGLRVVISEENIFAQFQFQTQNNATGTFSLLLESSGPGTKRFVCTGTCDNNIICKEELTASNIYTCDGCSDCKSSEVEIGHRPHALRNF